VGDLGHILKGYAGRNMSFDIFRKYIVGDTVLSERGHDPYTFDNVISRSATLVGRFNEIVKSKEYFFEILVVLHQGSSSKLYYIELNGHSYEVTYKAIGSGEQVADSFCSGIEHTKATMKDFAKCAYRAIEYMNRECPDLGVGLEPEGVPMIRYMNYNETWNKEPTVADMSEFKKFAQDQLDQK
jgi:20S proteasome alpha/beta subunit